MRWCHWRRLLCADSTCAAVAALDHLCCYLQELVNSLDKVVARGGADFDDALRALRARALGRRKTSL